MGQVKLTQDMNASSLFTPRGNLDGAKGSSDFTDVQQFIGLLIGEEEFMLPIEVMNEIIMIDELTFVPNSKEYIEGVLNLRGKIIPAINLRKMMGMPTIAPTGASRIIITRLDEVISGLIVDGITYVLALHPEQIEERTLNSSSGADIMSGISKRGDKINGILDLSKVLGKISELDDDDDE